ncbi:uncharacterized protein BKCO1_12000121 [Diplodia corticola]|uniref:NmrA-like domain-containing protein n=1 Tax=Diplodia corticola TaxID=236234 RepID=A0A1J9S9G8_9PEZI|nr:uncharacterized protein BKCO1_12000121 [Diplodia corticola]OJD36229.1 hypothetical protein BKCO1_12000121 [Diplodia corticola]
MSKTLLITGATGKQGGAVIKALLAADADFTILAVTRNPSSDSAKALEKQSPKIKVIKGDLNDPKAIFTAAGSPIWGVFSVQVPGGDGQTPETEEAQGKALIDAALAHGVQHFVYTSVERGAPRPNVPTEVPHFASKHRVEEHLLAKAGENNMTWTVIQPVAFLDNYSGHAPQFAAAFAAMWKSYLGEEQKLQVIASTDIGKVAARSFVQPDKYAGRKIPLAGDDLSYSDVKRIFKEKTGKDISEAPEQVARGIVESNADFKAMWTWFDTDGFGADVPALRKEFPDLMDYATWLVNEGGYNAQ